MRPTQPDPEIEKSVRLAYADLMRRLNDANLTREANTRLREDIDNVWVPRESEALNVSLRVINFIQKVIVAQNTRKTTDPVIGDAEFSAALLLEYLALAETLLKLNMCHIAVLASYAGLAVNIRGVVPKSHSDLIRSDIYVEDLAAACRAVGFREAIDKVFDNRIRRAIAHMDLEIGPTGHVTFFDTDRKGNRSAQGAPRSIDELQKMNWNLRDFAHSLALAMKDYMAAERGLGPAG
jgi:hypothetical protein